MKASLKRSKNDSFVYSLNYSLVKIQLIKHFYI